MADRFSSLRPDLAQWWREQPMFFVATAPSGDGGHVNLSPKGYDTLRVLAADRVAYLDLTGSGVETIAHLRDNGRITLMACAFSGNPRISRIYGRGAVHAWVRRSSTRSRRVPELPGAGRSSTSRSSGSRPRAATRCRSWIWSTTASGSSSGRRQGRRRHRRVLGNKNAESIDGLPGIDV